jgi:hypothetical protein
METLLASLETTTVVEEILRNSTDFFSPSDATCSDMLGKDCVIDHNVVCVGDPEYCNLTRDEYHKLLLDYIAPTVPEWILIFSHIVVFLMGLVSWPVN